MGVNEHKAVTDLEVLLRSLKPKLQDDFWVFTQTGTCHPEWITTPEVIAFFKETEAITLVCTEEFAINHDLQFHGVYRCITCNVYSSLEAVGMTAAISAKLTRYGISANVIAAYHHDHIFVPAGKAELAIQAMKELQV